MSLYLALCEAGSGWKKQLRYSNKEMMQRSGISRPHTFRTARLALMKGHGVIRFWQLDGRGTTFAYEMLDHRLADLERQTANPKIALAALESDDWGELPDAMPPPAKPAKPAHDVMTTAKPAEPPQRKPHPHAWSAEDEDAKQERIAENRRQQAEYERNRRPPAKVIVEPATRPTRPTLIQ